MNWLRRTCVILAVLMWGGLCGCEETEPEEEEAEVGLPRVVDDEILDQQDEGDGEAEDVSVAVDMPSCEDMEVEALGILEDRCVGCHSPAGSAAQTLLSDAIDVTVMVENMQIIPGNAADSPLMQSIYSGSMPKGQPSLSAESAELLEAWIGCIPPNQGAPAEGPGFISNAKMYQWILNDLQSPNVGSPSNQRYFSMVHLNNAGASVETIGHYRDAVNKLINSLSWADTATAAVVVPESWGLLLRIDMDDLDWDQPPLPKVELISDIVDVWSRLERAYPYAVIEQNSDSAQQAFLLTGVQRTPVINADWFAATAAVPPLYHEVLGLPDTLGQLAEVLGVDLQRNIDNLNVIRAGVLFSDVSVHNRVVERHEIRSNRDTSVFDYEGAFWLSYDFSDDQGLKSITQHPTDFIEDGHEVIFNLPNGLQAYLITEANGGRIDSAPINIVSDPYMASYHSTPEVINGLSCMSCHHNGMNDATDVVRDFVLESSSREYPVVVTGTVADLYPPQDEFQQIIDADSERFRDALEFIGLPQAVKREDEPVTNLAVEHLEFLNIVDVAAAVGLTEDEFLSHPGLERLRQSQASIGALVDGGPNGKIKRAVFDETFRDLTCFLGRGSPIGEGTEVGGLPNRGCAIIRLCNKSPAVVGNVSVTVNGVQIDALEGQCSPCRSMPVGDSLQADVLVQDVVQSVDEAGNINNVVANVLERSFNVDFADDVEYRLDLKAVVQRGVVLGHELEVTSLPGTTACEDSLSF